MASKATTTIKVRGEEIQREDQLPVVKDASNIVAREGEHTQGPTCPWEEPSKMKDDEWNDIDFRAMATIILCLSDEILYNWWTRKQLLIFGVGWKPLHDEELVE